MSSKTFSIITILSIICLIGTAYLFPVEVKKKEAVDFAAFQKGKFSGTSLDNKGMLFLGPRIKTYSGPGKEYYLGLGIAG
ncbi:MAG TPA: hypothetical protein VK469_22030, partial [Candidatus Kapabacteria bacterium]|nr:hypothetical protein [Candidatus Kapabacteria bacterium]